jgi:hypothetical protein
MSINILKDVANGRYVEAGGTADGLASVQLPTIQLYDWFSLVHLGLVPGATPFLMTNTRPILPANEIVTLWRSPLNYVHNKTATTISIVSSSVNDTAAGSGANVVGVDGIDSAGNFITEFVLMDGQTPAQTVQQFTHINIGAVIFSGATMFNEGIITFTINGQIVATMDPLLGQVTEGVFTPPVNHMVLIHGASFDVGKNNTGLLWINTIFSPDGGATFTGRRNGPILGAFQTTVIAGYPFTANPTSPFLTMVIEGQNVEAGNVTATAVISGVIFDNAFLP